MCYNSEFMNKAIEMAKCAAQDGEVPVGAVIVRHGEIISVGRNRREKGKNALYHAELEAIDSACKKLGGWRLPECDIYVTLEPCPMCAGAIINSRIQNVFFGAYDKKSGAVRSLVRLFDVPFNHFPNVVGGIEEDECSRLLSDFFKKLRESRSEYNKTQNK